MTTPSDTRSLCSRSFDDLRPGEQLRTHGRTITEFDIVAFGALTGDCAPQHLNRLFGERGPFGERIAHGALTIAYVLGLIPADPERFIAIRGLRDVKFKQPVRIGDTIHVEGVVGDCTPVGDEAGIVEIVVKVRNQHGNAVARLNLDVLWLRDPALKR